MKWDPLPKLVRLNPKWEWLFIIVIIIFILYCRWLRLFQTRIKSLHLLLGRPRDLFPAGILVLSLDILTNLSASILVTCSSHSLLLLLSTPLVNRLDTASYSIYFCFDNYSWNYSITVNVILNLRVSQIVELVLHVYSFIVKFLLARLSWPC